MKYYTVLGLVSSGFWVIFELFHECGAGPHEWNNEKITRNSQETSPRHWGYHYLWVGFYTRHTQQGDIVAWNNGHRTHENPISTWNYWHFIDDLNKYYIKGSIASSQNKIKRCNFIFSISIHACTCIRQNRIYIRRHSLFHFHIVKCEMNIVIKTAARKVDQIDDSEMLNMAANLEGKILLLLINCRENC